MTLLRIPYLKITLSVILSVIALLGCEKKTSEKHYKIGIVSLNKNHQIIIDNFKQQMKARGYFEGRNLTYYFDQTLNDKANVEPAVKRLLAEKVDIIWTLTTPATKIAKDIAQGSSSTVLFAPVFCPLDSKIVESLTHTGGNITGIKIRGHSAKALELFLSAVPETKTIFIPYHPSDFASRTDLLDLRNSAEPLQINIVEKPVNSSEELEAVLAGDFQNIDALWITHGNLIRSNIQAITKAALKHKIPTGSSSSLNSPVLLCYAISPANLGKQAARMADRILQGTPIEKLPVETAEYFLGINLYTAENLDIVIPDHLLKMADFVKR